jgi:hypothetical protein
LGGGIIKQAAAVLKGLLTFLRKLLAQIAEILFERIECRQRFRL